MGKVFRSAAVDKVTRAVVDVFGFCPLSKADVMNLISKACSKKGSVETACNEGLAILRSAFSEYHPASASSQNLGLVPSRQQIDDLYSECINVSMSPCNKGLSLVAVV